MLRCFFNKTNYELEYGSLYTQILLSNLFFPGVEQCLLKRIFRLRLLNTFFLTLFFLNGDNTIHNVS